MKEEMADEEYKRFLDTLSIRYRIFLVFCASSIFHTDGSGMRRRKPNIQIQIFFNPT